MAQSYYLNRIVVNASGGTPGTIDFTASTSVTAPSSFIGTGFTGPGGTLLTGRYLTMLDSAEINLRHQHNDRLDLLAGFRWIQLQDQLTHQDIALDGCGCVRSKSIKDRKTAAASPYRLIA